MGQGDRFRRKALKRGYKVDEVDEFLDRAEATLARRPTGEPLNAADIRDVVFRTRFGGYDEWQVDLHLDRLEKELDELGSGLTPRGSNGFRALEAGPSAYRDEREEVPAYPTAVAMPVMAAEPAYGAGYRGEPSGAYGRPGFREEPAGMYGQTAAYQEPEPYREEPSYGGYREEPSYGGGYRGAEPGYDRGPAPEYRSAAPAAAPSWAEPQQDPYRDDPRYRDAAPYQEPSYGGYREEPSYGGPGYRAPDRYGDAPPYVEQPSYGDQPSYVEQPSYGDQPSYVEQPSYGDGASYAAQGVYADRGGQYVEGPAYPEQYVETAPYVEQPSYAEARRYGSPGGYREGPSYAEGAPYQEAPSYAEGAPYSGGPYGSPARGRGGYPEPAPYRDGPSYGDLGQSAQFSGQYRSAEPPYRNGNRYSEPEQTGPHPVVSGVPFSGSVPPPRNGGRPGFADPGFREPRAMDPDLGRQGREMTMEMAAVPGLISPFTNEDKAVVAELRSSFRPRRFGSGYDPGQVERLFDAIQAMMEGRSGAQVSDSDLMPGQFGLVQGGYFEDDVDEALRQVRGLCSRRVG